MTSAAPPVDWQRLNEEFYSGDPAGYFRIRSNMLMLAAGASDEVQSRLEAGVRYDGLVTMELGRSSEERDDLIVAYLLTESQALLHHVSEALIRLFLAHASQPLCPWMEVAALRQFYAFKEQVVVLAGHTWPTALVDAVPHIFLGGVPQESSPSADEARETVTRLRRHLAAGLLKDANLYNSVKHGMAVVGSRDAYVTLATDGGEPFMGSQGPSVAFLESEREDDNRVWKVTRRWLSIRQAMWMSQLAVVEIDALWAVARARYLGVDLTGVHTITREALTDGITGAFADPRGINSFSTTVAVENLPSQSARKKPKGRRQAAP